MEGNKTDSQHSLGTALMKDYWATIQYSLLRITAPLPKKGHMSSSCQGKLWLQDTLSESLKKQQNKRVAPPVSLLQAEASQNFNYPPAATSQTSSGQSEAVSYFQ